MMYGDEIIDQGEIIKKRLISSGKEWSNNNIRYKLYTKATYMIHGELGKGVRRKLPSCVEQAIKDTYPSNDGDYIGFCKSNNR